MVISAYNYKEIAMIGAVICPIGFIVLYLLLLFGLLAYAITMSNKAKRVEIELKEGHEHYKRREKVHSLEINELMEQLNEACEKIKALKGKYHRN